MTTLNKAVYSLVETKRNETGPPKRNKIEIILFYNDSVRANMTKISKPAYIVYKTEFNQKQHVQIQQQAYFLFFNMTHLLSTTKNSQISISFDSRKIILYSFLLINLIVLSLYALFKWTFIIYYLYYLLYNLI